MVTFDLFCHRRTAGYMLFEALIAVAVAGIVLAAFVQTHALARRAAQMPADVLEPSDVAESLLEAWAWNTGEVASEGRQFGYSYSLQEVPAQLTSLPVWAAPPLAAQPPQTKPAQATQFEVRGIEIGVRSAAGRPLIREGVGVFPLER